MAKYLMRIETVESFKDIRGGEGGYWQILAMRGTPGFRIPGLLLDLGEPARDPGIRHSQ
jgi:hypothetical protein